MTLDFLSIFGAGLCTLLLATAMAEAEGRAELLQRRGPRRRRPPGRMRPGRSRRA